MQKTYTFAQGNAQPQQQATPAQQLLVRGFVEAAEEKQSKFGATFWKITIGGRTFNAWAELDLSNIEVGSYVAGNYVEVPNNRGGSPIKNLKSLAPVEPPQGQTFQPPQAAPQYPRSPQTGGNDQREQYWENRALRDNEKDLHIRREACWNIANQLVANAISAGSKYGGNATSLFEITKELAHLIDGDVQRPEGFATATPAPAPAPTPATGPIEATEEAME
jgi:hypothetical protein